MVFFKGVLALTDAVEWVGVIFVVVCRHVLSRLLCRGGELREGLLVCLLELR